VQEEVYKFFASEIFMLASYRLSLFINFSVSRQLGSKNYGAVPWVRQLVAGLLLQRPKFSPRPTGPSSVLGQSRWDLWHTKWHWDRQFSEYFSFPLSLCFY